MKCTMVLVVLVGLRGLVAAGAEVPAAPSFYEARSTLHRRVNGAQLSAEARIAGDKEAKIEISWKLDYTGPRQPLTILRPQLAVPTCGQTEVLVYAASKEGTPHTMSISSEMVADVYMARKEWFVTVERGTAATGTIEIPLARVREYFAKHWPRRFPEGVPLDLHVQLVHKPSDRGEEYALDAWTGQLHSQVVGLKAAASAGAGSTSQLGTERSNAAGTKEEPPDGPQKK